MGKQYLLYVLNSSINRHTSTVPRPESGEIVPLITKYNEVDYYYSEKDINTDAKLFFKQKNIKINYILEISEEQLQKMMSSSKEIKINKGDLVKYFNTDITLRVTKTTNNTVEVEIPFRHWILKFSDNADKFTKTQDTHIDFFKGKKYESQVLITFPDHKIDEKEILLKIYRLSLLFSKEIISYSENAENIKVFKKLNLPYMTKSPKVPSSSIIITDDIYWCGVSDNVYQYSNFLEVFPKYNNKDQYFTHYFFPNIKNDLIHYYHPKISQQQITRLKAKLTNSPKITRSNKLVAIDELFDKYISMGDINFAENLISFFSQLSIRVITKNIRPKFKNKTKVN